MVWERTRSCFAGTLWVLLLNASLLWQESCLTQYNETQNKRELNFSSFFSLLRSRRKEDTFRKVFPFMANEPWEIEWPIRLGGSLLHHLFKYPLLLKNLVLKDLCCRKTVSNNLYCLQTFVLMIFVAGKHFQITFIAQKSCFEWYLLLENLSNNFYSSKTQSFNAIASHITSHHALCNGEGWKWWLVTTAVHWLVPNHPAKLSLMTPQNLLLMFWGLGKVPGSFRKAQI